jgi:hypothetical protein
MILVDILNFPFKEFLTDNNIYYMDKPYTLMGHDGCTQNYPCSDKQTVKDISERKNSEIYGLP